MLHMDLFSGIGGFALAVEEAWPDARHIFCDNDRFCQNVLKKHWPEAEIWGDIRELISYTKRERLEGNEGELEGTETEPPRPDSGLLCCKTEVFPRTSVAETELIAHAKGQRGRQEGEVQAGRSPAWGSIDILTGGFPCQPFSHAGKRRGKGDDRFLWPEMLECIRIFKPKWVIAENVYGLLSIQQGLVFEQVCFDMEKEGYEVWPFIVPACAVGAPHRRDRVWIVGHDKHGKREEVGQVQEGCANSPRSDGIDTNSKSGGDRFNNRRNSHIADFGKFNSYAPDTSSIRQTGQEEIRELDGSRFTFFDKRSWQRDWKEVALGTCVRGVDDGLPRRVVRLPDGTSISEAGWRKEALKAYGNSIVPEVAGEIMKAIRKIEKEEICYNKQV